MAVYIDLEVNGGSNPNPLGCVQNRIEIGGFGTVLGRVLIENGDPMGNAILSQNGRAHATLLMLVVPITMLRVWIFLVSEKKLTLV